MKIKFELLIITIIIVINLLFGILFQPQITHNEGLGWDGRDYYKVALDFKNNNFPEARAPFVYRMGTPILVSQFFPNDMQFGFKIINLSASILAFFALWYFLLIAGSNSLLRVLLMLSYITYWQNPMRMTFFYPIHSDPVAVLFLFINLIIAYKIYLNKNNRYIILLTISTFISTFFREITLIPAFVLFLSSIKNERKLKLDLESKLFIPVISGIIVIIITHLIGKATDSYSFFNSAIGWIYRKSTIMYIHSIMLSVGPIAIFGFYFYKDSKRFLSGNKFILYFLLSVLFVSYAGGSDTERLIMWGVPGIYFLLANVIYVNKQFLMSKFLITVVIISQLISNRAFLVTPDFNENALSAFPFLTPFTNDFRVLDLWVIHANSRFILISAIEYAILAIIIIFLLKFLNKMKQN